MLCSQDGSQACRGSGRSDHRGVTKARLVGAEANRLFFVFIGFEPLPQKEVGEGGQSDVWPGEMRYSCHVSG